jgi:hypothetical protein
MARFMPDRVFCLPLCHLGLTLFPRSLPLCILCLLARTLLLAFFPGQGLIRLYGGLALDTDRTPSRVFQLAFLTDHSTLLPKLRLFAIKGPFHSSGNGLFRWRSGRGSWAWFRPLLGCSYEAQHRFFVVQCWVFEHPSGPRPFAGLCFSVLYVHVA